MWKDVESSSDFFEKRKRSVARQAAHAAFDKLWDTDKPHKNRRRSLAYVWLAQKLDIPRDECHMSQFNYDICDVVINLSEKRLLLYGPFQETTDDDHHHRIEENQNRQVP